jgi:hypothetical protein
MGVVTAAGGLRAPLFRYWVSGFLADIGDGRDRAERAGRFLPDGRSRGLASLLMSW